MRSAVSGRANKSPLLSHPTLSQSPESAHTQTHTYIRHAVFIGLNDSGDNSPSSKREGTSCQHGPLHLSSQTKRRDRENLFEMEVEVTKRKADPERLTRAFAENKTLNYIQ